MDIFLNDKPAEWYEYGDDQIMIMESFNENETVYNPKLLIVSKSFFNKTINKNGKFYDGGALCVE